MARVCTAAVAILVAVVGVFALPALWFFVALLVVVEIVAVEYLRLSSRTGALLGAVLLALVPLAAMTLGPLADSAPVSQRRLALTVVSVVPVVAAIGLLAVRPARGLSGAATLAFGLPYLAAPAAALYHLKLDDPWLLMLLFVLVWSGDTAAFLVGRRWGRRRLAPRVSPNKTWEGSAAGLAVPLALAALYAAWRGPVMAPAAFLGLAAAASVAGQMGDLVASALKRAAGVKDSGRILPGHGGLLDRLDALLLAAPVFFLGLLWGGALEAL